MIPEGWTARLLGELFDFKNGLNAEKHHYGSGTKFANVMDVLNTPQLTARHITGSVQATPKQIAAYSLRFGDVLFNRTSETQEDIALAAVYMDHVPVVFGGFVIRARPKGGDIDPNFCLFAFSSKAIRDGMIRLGQGAVRSNIGQGDLATVQILLPSLPEQHKIAEILSTWDRAIETVEALIANAREQKAALMQALLTGKRRLPGFEEDWHSMPISSMGAIASGGTPDSSNPAYWDGDIAWATPTDITKLRTRHISQTDRSITAAGLSASAARLLPAGTVIVCTRATVGALAIAVGPICTNQGFKNIVPNQKYDSAFLYYLLSFNEKALLRAAAGSTFAEVSKTDFERLVFSVPKLEEQRAITSILIAADDELEKFEAKLIALRQEKAALMQQLLTGKRRVTTADTEAA